MKTHNDFLEDVQVANSIPEQIKKSIEPETEKDFAFYTEGEGK